MSSVGDSRALMSDQSHSHHHHIVSPVAEPTSPAHQQPAVLASPGSQFRARKDRPCDACRRRKTRCVTQPGSAVCGFCRLHSKDCTYLEKPLPRKRKAKHDSTEPDARRARVARGESSPSSHSDPLFKSDLAGVTSEQALLTPVSDIHLDWWPRQDPAADPRPHVEVVELAGLPLNDPYPEVDLDAALVTMSWRVPRKLAGDQKSEACARLIHEKWAALLNRQAATDLPELPSESLAAIFDVTTIAQHLEPFHAPDDVVDGMVFERMTTLSQILGHFLETFPTAMPTLPQPLSDPTRDALTRAKPVQIALKDWFTTLPQQLKMDLTPSPQDHHTAKASLHLCYYAFEVHLHTRIISSISSVTTSSELIGICRHAAKSRLLSAMDFANRLRPSQLQALSWHPPAAANFAAMGTFADLLRRTAPEIEESRWYEQRLREFRWTVGVSNRNATWLSPVVDLMDGLLERPTFAC